MKILVGISRWIVGILFIFSGFIKLNDPIGFSFKLEEYFSPSVLDLEFLAPYALIIAILLVIFELVLGVMLLHWLFAKVHYLGLVAHDHLFHFPYFLFGLFQQGYRLRLFWRRHSPYSLAVLL